MKLFYCVLRQKSIDWSVCLRKTLSFVFSPSPPPPPPPEFQVQQEVGTPAYRLDLEFKGGLEIGRRGIIDWTRRRHGTARQGLDRETGDIHRAEQKKEPAKGNATS